MPIVQVLDVPAFDLTLSSPSMNEYDTGAGLTRAAVDEYAEMYCASTPRTHPHVSPLHAEDLSGLPPAMVVVAEHDPVRDDGERYVARLWEAGVPATCTRVIGHFHGGWMIPISQSYLLVNDLRVAALRRAFSGTLTA
jgi:acetyl esterase